MTTHAPSTHDSGSQHNLLLELHVSPTMRHRSDGGAS